GQNTRPKICCHPDRVSDRYGRILTKRSTFAPARFLLNSPPRFHEPAAQPGRLLVIGTSWNRGIDPAAEPGRDKGMKRLLLGATALTMMTGAAYADYTLNILHINDFHSRFDPITGSDSDCDAETDAAGECFGGIARLKAIIDETRGALEAEDANVLLLSAGD